MLILRVGGGGCSWHWHGTGGGADSWSCYSDWGGWLIALIIPMCVLYINTWNCGGGGEVTDGQHGPAGGLVLVS